MREVVLAADLGGTNLRMAVLDREGSILYRTKRKTPRATERPDEIVREIVEAARECKENCKGEKITAFAAAVPGTVSVERAVIMKAPNLPALDGFRIGVALEHDLNIKTFLENDANAAAIGENWLGASRGVKSSICVTLGTGVGGGIIIDNKILRGVDGTAAEIGHICVEPFGAPCGCGSRGCVEQYASATAIERMTQELATQYPESDLSAKAKLTAKDIFAAGQAGDELALEVFRRQGFYLGLALAGLINVLNPEAIVIGGGAAAGWDLFVPHLKETIQDRAYREPAARARLMRAECGDDAGILGVAKLAFES